MPKIQFYDNFEIAFKDVNLDFDERKYNMFMQYLDLILKWNEKINLTSITDKKQIIQKHFIDSVKIYKFPSLIDLKNVIDIGTGAGFPGVPMKIANDSINITLVDSTLKKVKFLNELISKLKLTSTYSLHERAENLCRQDVYREKFDLVVSRAVANLKLLCEICLPLVKKDKYFVALKGPSVYEEIKDASKNIGIFGGRIVDVKEVNIETSNYRHNIVIIEKMEITPGIFPRKPKTIGKDACFT